MPKDGHSAEETCRRWVTDELHDVRMEAKPGLGYARSQGRHSTTFQPPKIQQDLVIQVSTIGSVGQAGR